jgi:hypothetical protein
LSLRGLIKETKPDAGIAFLPSSLRGGYHPQYFTCDFPIDLVPRADAELLSHGFGNPDLQSTVYLAHLFL